MGYDLQMVRVPASVPATYQPQTPARPGEYQLTMYDMRVVFAFMGAPWANVLWDPGWPAFPDPKAFELTGDDLQAATRAPEVQARYDRFRAAYEEVVHLPALQDGKVALYKWSSNDGWWVSPEECRVVAAKVRAAADRIVGEYLPTENLDPADARTWVDRWVAYHEVAADHGGYRVR